MHMVEGIVDTYPTAEVIYQSITSVSLGNEEPAQDRYHTKALREVPSQSSVSVRQLKRQSMPESLKSQGRPLTTATEMGIYIINVSREGL